MQPRPGQQQAAQPQGFSQPQVDQRYTRPPPTAVGTAPPLGQQGSTVMQPPSENPTAAARPPVDWTMAAGSGAVDDDVPPEFLLPHEQQKHSSPPAAAPYGSSQPLSQPHKMSTVYSQVPTSGVGSGGGAAMYPDILGAKPAAAPNATAEGIS